MTSTTFFNDQTLIVADWCNDVDQVVYDGVQLYGEATGTADAMAVILSPVPVDYVTGMEIRVKAPGPNTITTPTINCNGKGVRTITKLGSRALLAGDIRGTGHELLLRYNGVTFELLNPSRELIQLDTGVPTSKKHYYSNAIPASGTFSAGEIVWNSVTTVAGVGGSQYHVVGWKRVTTGSAHVLNTDWVEMRCLTGT